MNTMVIKPYPTPASVLLVLTAVQKNREFGLFGKNCIQPYRGTKEVKSQC